MIKEKIRKLVKKAIQDLKKKKSLPDFDLPAFRMEFPPDEKFGDYACNAAMLAAPQAKMEPTKLGQLIVDQLMGDKEVKEMFEKVELAKPGFINFTLSSEFLSRQVREILRLKDKFGQSKVGRGQKVQVEFISANPTGPLHLGNGRGGFLGDVLANVLSWSGFKVQREYYINDTGEQIRKLGGSLWYYILEMSNGKKKEDLPEDLYRGKYIKNLAQEIFKQYRKKINFESEKAIKKIGEIAVEIVLQDIKRITQKAGIKFNRWFSETKELHQSGKIERIKDFLLKNNLMKEEKGAWWLKTKEVFDDEKDRVLIKKTGEPTYFLVDIAYHKDKFDRGFDRVIDIWGADHSSHVRQMQTAMEILGQKGKLDIIVVQLVRLIENGQEIKMSKRTGSYITLEELVDEIGLDVARFFFLTHAPNTHLDFDLNLAKERSEKNPVFYIQYAYARICSIIKKTKGLKGRKRQKKAEEGYGHSAEIELIKELIKFPELLRGRAGQKVS